MKRFYTLLWGFLLLFSCTKPLDFDQAKTFEAFPVFEGDIFYLDLHKPNLTDNQGNFRETIYDTLDFGVFKDHSTRNNFIKAEIYIKYSNSFQRHFLTHVFYIDNNQQIVEQDSLDIQPATSSIVEGENIYEYSKALNPEFVNFRKIVLKIDIYPANLPVEDELLHIQSKAKFYIRAH